MDTANLEEAARRYRDAEAALDTARTGLQTETLDFLHRYASERGAQTAAVRITGWSREHLRGLKKKADNEAERARRETEVESLRRKLAELSVTQTPAGSAGPRSAARKPQTPQPKPEPQVKERPLTEEEAAEHAALARSRADERQLKRLEQDTLGRPDGLRDFIVISSAMGMGLLTHDEVYGERPTSTEES